MGKVIDRILKSIVGKEEFDEDEYKELVKKHKRALSNRWSELKEKDKKEEKEIEEKTMEMRIDTEEINKRIEKIEQLQEVLIEDGWLEYMKIQELERLGKEKENLIKMIGE